MFRLYYVSPEMGLVQVPALEPMPFWEATRKLLERRRSHVGPFVLRVIA
jgi:hypothetical protein